MAEKRSCSLGHERADAAASCPQCAGQSETVTEGAALPPPPGASLPQVPDFASPATQLASDRTAAPLPKILDFEILKELGRGGMGVVYLARQLSLKRLVAIKMLPTPQAHDQALARFRQEAEAVARLQHPHIVQIHAIGDSGGSPYLALEYVNGGSLQQLLQHAPQPGRLAAQLAETLARAIHHAHLHGVIHRDLKPANVLLQIPDSATLNLSSAIPKVTDFGLAKQLDADSGQTQTGAILGTPSYMAPEQAEGNPQAVGPLADVYGLGAVLYEMLTGRPPFRAATSMQTVREVLTREVTPPSRLAPRVHRDLETICLKALAKEPQRRYSSALALAEDLARFQAGDAILARREGLLAKVRRKARRHPAALIMLGIAIVAVAATALWMTSLSRATRDASRLAGLVEQEMSRPELGEPYLLKVESTLAQLAELDGDQAVALRARLYERYGEAFLAALKNRTLRDEDVASLKIALAPLAAHQPDLQEMLASALHKRLAQWQMLFDLSSPFAERGTVFPAGAVRADKSALFTAGDQQAQQAPRFTLVRSRGNVRLEATFGDGWQAAPKVGLLVHASLGAPGEVKHLTPSPDGRWLAAQGGGRGLQLWDTATGSVRFALPPSGKKGTPFPCAFAPDSKVLAHGSDPVRFLDLDTLQDAPHLDGPPGKAESLAYSPDGKKLLIGHTTGKLTLWDLADKKAITSSTGHRMKVLSVCFLHDGKILSFGQEAITFAADGFNVAHRGHEASVRLWNATTLELEKEITRDKALPWKAIPSPDGKTLAMSFDLHGHVRLVDVPNGNGLAGPLRASGRGSAMDFAPDGSVLALVQDGELQLLEPRTGKVQRRLQDPRMLHLCSVSFSHDGRLLYAGNQAGVIYVWEMASGRLRSIFGARSYEFLVSQTRATSGSATAEGDAGPDHPSADRAYLQILRDGVLLREEAVGQLPAGPLTLSAQREGIRLTFQVGALPPVVFEEALGAGVEHHGVFGVHWPDTAPLLHLRASQQLLPPDSSPLEHGDALYARGELAEALALYEQQLIQAKRPEVMQECRYKQALCLAGLGKEAEASAVLEPLGQEEGERWPALALIELLQARLRQRRLEDAEVLFDVLRTRHRLENLSAFLPGESRAGIIKAYREFAQVMSYFKVDAKRLRVLERGAQLEEALSGGHSADLRFRLIRHYHAAGQTDAALTMAQQALAQRMDTGAALEASWLLRLRGDNDKALEQLERWIFLKPKAYRGGTEALRVERARALVAAGQMQVAEEDCLALLDQLKLGSPRVAAALVLGFLREERGDSKGALQAWQEGLLAAEQANTYFGFEFLHNQILASLTDNYSDEDARIYQEKITRAMTGDLGVTKAATQMLNVSPDVLRAMWRTPRGKELARHVAFRTISFREILRQSSVLFICEWARHDALGGKTSAEEDAALWDVFSDLHAAYEKGQLGGGQLVPLALTWKGVAGALGWGGVEKKLTPRLRAGMAYVFGHRYVVLKNDAQALAFFRLARDQAQKTGQASLAALATRETARLEKSEGKSEKK